MEKKSLTSEEIQGKKINQNSLDCVQISSQFYEEECEEVEDTHFDFRDPVPQLQHEKRGLARGVRKISITIIH